MCPAQIAKTKTSQHTINPKTGLTPLQKRQLTLKETIDLTTGLSLFEMRVKKMQKSQTTPDPITGLTPRARAEHKLKQIDLITGKTLKQVAGDKATQTLKQVDILTGKTGLEKRAEKTHFKIRNFDLEKKQAIQTKRQDTMDKVDPTTGLTKRQLAGKKISTIKNTIDLATGLTVAQKTAQKNKNNPNWLKNNTRGRASKESLKLFNPLLESLKDLGLKIYLGSNDNREWFLHDYKNNCIRFYDFCIPDLKIIIEYNGEHYHPNPQVLDEKTWKSWKMPYTGISADEARTLDILKETLAIQNGFDYHVVWSSEDLGKACSRLFACIMLKVKASQNL